MTPTDRAKERTAYMAERLGIICGAAEPTERQKRQALLETDRHMEECEEKETFKRWQAAQKETKQ